MDARRKVSGFYQIRVDDKWKRQATESARKRRLNTSDYVRGCVEYATLLERKSPYVCEDSFHFLYVTRTGNIYLRHVEKLAFNEDLPFIYSSVPMKHDAACFLFEKYKGDAKQVRETWVFNRFSLWDHDPESSDLRPSLIDGSDTDGVTTKLVRLDLPIFANSVLWRESIVVLKDYAMRQDANTRAQAGVDAWDYVDFPVDVPITGEKRLLVVIDSDFYKDTPGYGTTFNPLAKLVWRNRDMVPFHEDPVANEFPIQKISKLVNRDLPETQDAALKEVTKLAAKVLDTIEVRAELTVKLGDIPTQVEHKLPGEFILYFARIPWVSTDSTPTVSWPKPIRNNVQAAASFQSRAKLRRKR